MPEILTVEWMPERLDTVLLLIVSEREIMIEVARLPARMAATDKLPSARIQARNG